METITFIQLLKCYVDDYSGRYFCKQYVFTRALCRWGFHTFSNDIIVDTVMQLFWSAFVDLDNILPIILFDYNYSLSIIFQFGVPIIAI